MEKQLTRNGLNTKELADMLIYTGEKIIESKPFLTEIDSAIGDGDHGIGMEVGFKEVIRKLSQTEYETINDVFKETGMAMLSTMGGASGVIFGTLFISGTKNMPVEKELHLKWLSEAFSESLTAIKKRGKADLGDKTMIDALEPAVEALKTSAQLNLTLFEGLREAEKHAYGGVENSKQYEAKFGRAKSLGRRAVGHQDAGATSVWIIFKSMREWMEGNIK